MVHAVSLFKEWLCYRARTKSSQVACTLTDIEIARTNLDGCNLIRSYLTLTLLILYFLIYNWLKAQATCSPSCFFGQLLGESTLISNNKSDIIACVITQKFLRAERTMVKGKAKTFRERKYISGCQHN